jgi:A/G-specific adenine glycosylase
VSVLQERLLEWYGRFGRSRLPWRMSRDPYYTLVSEFMLQQTQVDRVIPKFEAFIARFPSVAALADASVADVLRMWQGLGYNSRAVRLHAVARAVVECFESRIPREREALLSLPGIGPYTASAIRAFAFDEDEAAVDTNIRRVVHRVTAGVEFPPLRSTGELDREAQALVARGRGHDWNSAMMDLGASICTARAPKCLLCPLTPECAAAPIDAAALEQRRRRHTKPRSPQEAIPFEQTTRFARGRIVDRLRALPPGERISLLDLHGELRPLLAPRSLDEVTDIVAVLHADGLVAYDGHFVALRES